GLALMGNGLILKPVQDIVQHVMGRVRGGYLPARAVVFHSVAVLHVIFTRHVYLRQGVDHAVIHWPLAKSPLGSRRGVSLVEYQGPPDKAVGGAVEINQFVKRDRRRVSDQR